MMRYLYPVHTTCKNLTVNLQSQNKIQSQTRCAKDPANRNRLWAQRIQNLSSIEARYFEEIIAA